MVRDGIEQVRLHLAARDAARESSVYFCEVSSNLELLLDVNKGEIPDLKAERKIFTADSEAARKASAKATAKIPPLDLEGFMRLFSGSPPPPSAPEAKHSSSAATPRLTPDRISLVPPADLATDVPATTSVDATVFIDEFGSNIGPKMGEMVEEIRAATEEDPA